MSQCKYFNDGYCKLAYAFLKECIECDFLKKERKDCPGYESNKTVD